MILVSACLIGEPCRYDGKATPVAALVKLYKEEKAIAVCPEVLGGLKTPRPCVELQTIEGGLIRALDAEGRDVTQAFKRGAEKTLQIAVESGCAKAILKSRSPSCGKGRVYDGSFEGVLVDGDGITAALLEANGVEVVTESAYADE